MPAKNIDGEASFVCNHLNILNQHLVCNNRFNWEAWKSGITGAVSLFEMEIVAFPA